MRTVELPLPEGRGGPVHTGDDAAALLLALLAPDPEPLPLPLPLPLEAAAGMEVVADIIDTETVAGETKMAKTMVLETPLDVAPIDDFK